MLYLGVDFFDGHVLNRYNVLVVELVDTIGSNPIASACSFESSQGHQNCYGVRKVRATADNRVVEGALPSRSTIANWSYMAGYD